MPSQPLHLEDSKALQNYYVGKQTHFLLSTTVKSCELTTLHAESQVIKLRVISDLYIRKTLLNTYISITPSVRDRMTNIVSLP